MSDTYQNLCRMCKPYIIRVNVNFIKFYKGWIKTNWEYNKL